MKKYGVVLKENGQIVAVKADDFYIESESSEEQMIIFTERGLNCFEKDFAIAMFRLNDIGSVNVMEEVEEKVVINARP